MMRVTHEASTLCENYNVRLCIKQQQKIKAKGDIEYSLVLVVGNRKKIVFCLPTPNLAQTIFCFVM